MSRPEIDAALSALDRLVDYFQGRTAGDTQASNAKADYDTIKTALTAAKSAAWVPIETAPRDGTPILARSSSYKIPFVTYWGSAAMDRGDIPALPSGSSIERHWVLSNCEIGNCLYDPDEWLPLPPSTTSEGAK